MKSNREDVLKKAIEKAMENGWDTWWRPYYLRAKNKIKVKLLYKETLEGIAVVISDKGSVDWDGHAEVQLIINGNTHCYVVLGDKGAYGVQPVAISCVRVK